MLTFRRALVVAAVILTLLLLLRNTHPARATAAFVHSSPKPTSISEDNKILPQPTPESSTHTAPAKPASTAPQWTGDIGDRVAWTKKPVGQIPLEDLHAQPIRRQLAYSFPYNPTAKFPAYIWQTWKYQPSSGDFSDDLRAAEASWTELHPNFVHEVVTDSVAVHLIRHFYASIPEVCEAYEALPQPVLKADFFRYLILLARGGIYTDIDTTALKSAVEWVPAELPRSSYGLVIGIEADPDRPDWRDWYSRRIQFCQWTIQAKPGHPVLVDIVAAITEETLRRKAAGELDRAHMRSVVEFTGPAIWTDTLFRFFNNADYFDMSTSTGNITWQLFTGITTAKKVGDVVVLPITCFSPGVGQMGAGEDDDPMAFVKHGFAGTYHDHDEERDPADASDLGSWKPDQERHIGH